MVIQLRDDLRERGHEVWFDEERLLPSADWEVRIEEGLRWTAENKPHAAVILLLTLHSVRRPEGVCLNEVARALMLNLRIIPLMVIESEPPLSICRIQWLDMRECIPIHEKKALYEPRFKRLLAALEKEELDYEGLQSRLLRTLQPIEFSADLFKLLRDFTGRKWVFAEIDAWFKNPAGPKLFWVTGAAIEFSMRSASHDQAAATAGADGCFFFEFSLYHLSMSCRMTVMWKKFLRILPSQT